MTHKKFYEDCMELPNSVASVKMNFDNVICVIESEHGFTIYCVGGFNLFLTHEQKASVLGNLLKGGKND